MSQVITISGNSIKDFLVTIKEVKDILILIIIIYEIGTRKLNQAWNVYIKRLNSDEVVRRLY